VHFAIRRRADDHHRTRVWLGELAQRKRRVDTLPKLLGLPQEVIDAHVKAGAPVARDGTVNLIHFAAWLNQQLCDSNNGQ
jgi:hypothetical protein